MFVDDLCSAGDLVLSLGEKDFEAHFFRFFDAMIGIEHCAGFAFRNAPAPSPVIIEAKTDDGRSLGRDLASAYVNGAYANDPNLACDPACAAPTVLAVDADDQPVGEFREFFYEKPGLTRELLVVGAVDGTNYYISFLRRRDQPAFGVHEVEQVSRLADFAIKTLHRHRKLRPELTEQDQASAAPKRDQVLRHLRSVLLSEPAKLSPREAEICAGIILGYTTLALSLNFGISLNTVATHRKRAYNKLGVCSQNELFERYFETVARSRVQLSAHAH